MDDEDLKEDLAILEFLESLPEQPSTAAERKSKERGRWGPGGRKAFEKGGDRFSGHYAWAELYTRLALQFGRDEADRLAEQGGVFAAWAALTHIWDDLELWLEATAPVVLPPPPKPADMEKYRDLLREWGDKFLPKGEGKREVGLREVERLGLECWLWERHDRHRQAERFKPKKSPDHDAPWRDPPAKWAPRRWFTWRRPLGAAHAGLMSVSRALNQERAKIRALLATEIKGEGNDPWRTEPLAERKDPKPQGFWSVKQNPLTGVLLWHDRWDPPRWEPCDDDPCEWSRDHRWHRWERADALSEKRKECRRRRDAAIDGLLSNFGCV